MAGTNVGNLNATLSLSEFEFTHGLDQSAAAALEFAAKTEVAARRADAALSRVGKGGAGGFGGSSAMTVGLQQAAYAAQDFGSQINNGLRPALASVSNNLLFASSFIPGVGKVIGTIAAVALPFAPDLAQAVGLWKDNAKAVDTFADSWKKMTKEITSSRVLTREAIKMPVNEFDKGQQGRRDKMSDLNNEIIVLNAQITELQSVADPTGERTEKAASLRKQAEESLAQWKAIQKEGKALADLRPQVVENEAMREREKMEAKLQKDSEETEKRAIEESSKLRLDLLEKYGTESQKLEARQARERDEFAIKSNGDIAGLDLLEKAQAAERKKLSIDDMEKGLSKAGKDPGMSAGLDLNSAAGISAINKALTGTGQQSLEAQMLEVEKRQLALMEQEARGMEVSNGEKQLIAGEQLEPVLGEPELIGKIGPEDRQRRGAEFNKDSAEQLKVMKELLKANLEIARKSDRTVVKLSGS